MSPHRKHIRIVLFAVALALLVGAGSADAQFLCSADADCTNPTRPTCVVGMCEAPAKAETERTCLMPGPCAPAIEVPEGNSWAALSLWVMLAGVGVVMVRSRLLLET